MIKKLKPFQYFYNVFVGIPKSQLYQHIINNNLYEFMDDIGLVYLPGYDIKTKFFYKIDSKQLVNHEFQKKTEFDEFLINRLQSNHPKSGGIDKLLKMFKVAP